MTHCEKNLDARQRSTSKVKLSKWESEEIEGRKKKRLRKHLLPLSVGYGMPDNPFLFSECLHSFL